MRMVSGIIVALMALSVSGVTPYGEARRFVGHTGIINSLAFSPDETLIASGSNDRTVRIWDVASGKQLHKLEGHTDMVNDLVFSSDGKRLFSSGMDGQARIWDVKTGELLFVLQKRNGRHIHAGAMSPDGKFALLGSCDATLELWDVEKEKMIRSMNFVRQIDAVAFAPDSQRFFVGCEGEIQNGRDAAGKLTIFHENSGIWVFDIAKEDLVKQVADHGATSIQFSADGRTVAFLGDNAIWRMDSRTFEILGQFKPPQHQGKFLDHFALSADGKNAMGCLGHATYYLNLDANRVARAYLPFHEILLKTALSPKGHWAAVAGGGTSRAVTIPGGIRSDAPSVIRLFDLTDGWEPPRYLAQKAPTDTLEYVQYTPDDRVILTISHGGALGLWDLSTRKELSRFEISKGHHMVIFDSGKQLARWIKKVIELYDVPSGKKIADIPSPNSDISTAAPSADGKTLYIAGGSSPTRTQAGFNLQVDEIEIPSGKKLRSLAGLESRPFRVALSPDGKYLFGFCRSQPNAAAALVAWDLTTGKLLWNFKPPSAKAEKGDFAVSKDGMVAACWDRVTFVINVSDGKTVAAIDKNPNAVNSMSFDPDGKHIWTVCGDSKVRSWEIATGKLLETVEFGFTPWNDNRVRFRQGKPYLMGFGDYGIEEIPLKED